MRRSFMIYARGFARSEVPARAALVGNPSDGFGGATIAVTLPDLSAVVEAEPALRVRLEADGEALEFDDLAALAAAGERGDYPATGPLRLLMAAAKRYSQERAQHTEARMRLTVAGSAIPSGVGLAGSSAIVIGALRALGDLFGEPVAPEELPQVALRCETEELGILAGLQDRVVQAMGGLVFMDFDPATASGGRFEPLDAGALPPLFVAWLADSATDSGAVHLRVRERFEAGDREVVDTMGEIADLARRALTPILTGDSAGLGVLMDRNLELRERIYDLDPGHARMVAAARDLGAPVNYTGSGGAIVGLYRDQEHLAQLREALEPLGCELLVRAGA